MNIVIGLIVLVLSLLAWGGQTLTWLAPKTAERLALTEPERQVDPTFWADVRGEAVWDALTLWTLVVAGVLIAMEDPSWTYFGLVGGATYVYFAGRGIVVRTVMRRRHLRIGSPSSVRLAFVLLSVWGIMGALVIGAALISHLN